MYCTDSLRPHRTTDLRAADAWIPVAERAARIRTMRPHMKCPHTKNVVLLVLLAKEHRRRRRLGERRVRNEKFDANETHLTVRARFVDENFGVRYV